MVFVSSSGFVCRKGGCVGHLRVWSVMSRSLWTNGLEVCLWMIGRQLAVRQAVRPDADGYPPSHGLHIDGRCGNQEARHHFVVVLSIFSMKVHQEGAASWMEREAPQERQCRSQPACAYQPPQQERSPLQIRERREAKSSRRTYFKHRERCSPGGRMAEPWQARDRWSWRVVGQGGRRLERGHQISTTCKGQVMREEINNERSALIAMPHHPNIVWVIGGRMENDLMIVEELMPINLARLLSESWPDLAYHDILRIGLDIAKGMCHLRGHSYAHIDMTPSSILPDEARNAMLVGFSDTKCSKASTFHTASDGVPGSMAPECFPGNEITMRESSAHQFDVAKSWRSSAACWGATGVTLTIGGREG